MQQQRSLQKTEMEQEATNQKRAVQKHRRVLDAYRRV